MTICRTWIRMVVLMTIAKYADSVRSWKPWLPYLPCQSICGQVSLHCKWFGKTTAIPGYHVICRLGHAGSRPRT